MDTKNSEIQFKIFVPSLKITILPLIKSTDLTDCLRLIKPRSFQVGDLVFTVKRLITTHRMGNNFFSKWDGPYVVQDDYTNGVYKILTKIE